MPPAATIPAVPGGFLPVPAADLQGYRPFASALAAAPDALAELQAFADYAATFGITAPPYEELLRRLALAVQWTAMLAQTAAWLEYAKSQEGTAWKDALQLVQKLKRPFELATAADPARLGRYPALGRLLGASRAVSKRAVATRVRNRKADSERLDAPEHLDDELGAPAVSAGNGAAGGRLAAPLDEGGIAGGRVGAGPVVAEHRDQRQHDRGHQDAPHAPPTPDARSGLAVALPSSPSDAAVLRPVPLVPEAGDPARQDRGQATRRDHVEHDQHDAGGEDDQVRVAQVQKHGGAPFGSAHTPIRRAALPNFIPLRATIEEQRIRSGHTVDLPTGGSMGLERPPDYVPPPPPSARDVARTLRTLATSLVPTFARLALRRAGSLPTTATAEGLAMVRASATPTLRRLGVELEVLFAERVAAQGGLVLFWNQESHLDHLVLASAAPRPFFSLYNNEIARFPFYGEYMRAGGHVHVDRNDEAQWRPSVTRAAERVRAGECVLVSPEGTRSWDGRLLPMKRGALQLALASERSVVCVTVIGGHARLPRGSPVVRAGRLRVVFAEPIAVGAGAETAERRPSASSESR